MATFNASPMKFKLIDQSSPRRSERKRSLFPSNSPQPKDGIGRFSPLNSSPEVYSPPLPSPSWSISSTQHENGYLSPKSRIKFDNLLKAKCQLEFHSLSPKPAVTKSPRKSRKASPERNFLTLFEKFPNSPEKQDPNNLPSTSKYEITCNEYNKIKQLHTPKKKENPFLLRRSPRNSSEKRKLEIKPRTFYGTIAPILATNQTNCIQGIKRVFRPLPIISKAKTKLFMDEIKNGSKRNRSKSSDSFHRSKKRKEIYPGVRHSIQKPKTKPEEKHVALVKADSVRDKIKKTFDFSRTPYSVKRKRNDGWDYPAKFTKSVNTEEEGDQNRKFFKSSASWQCSSGTVSQPLLSSLGTIKKRKLLDTRCEYYEDNVTKRNKDTKLTSNDIDPSDILDLIEDGRIEEVNNEKENKDESDILLDLVEDEEDSLDRTRRELIELFYEDSSEELREESTLESTGLSVDKLADSTAILGISENARDFIPSFAREKDTKENKDSPQSFSPSLSNTSSHKENKDSPQRFFPIFSNTSPQSPKLADVTNKKQTKEKYMWKLLIENQMQIDAGQKQFGATQCSECGLVYQIGEPDDENQHNLYHSSYQTLRHPGWKNEVVVGYFQNERIIMVTPSDSKSWQSKTESILQIVDKDLGFTSNKSLSSINFKAFLYISDKTIVGCLIAIPLTTAYKMYVSETDMDICSKETYQVKCGISRIWTHSLSRRQGVASKLVDTLRRNFMYGHILSKEDIAFSVPSPDGKRFAQKYMGKSDYYVFCNF